MYMSSGRVQVTQKKRGKHKRETLAFVEGKKKKKKKNGPFSSVGGEKGKGGHRFNHFVDTAGVRRKRKKKGKKKARFFWFHPGTREKKKNYQKKKEKNLSETEGGKKRPCTRKRKRGRRVLIVRGEKKKEIKSPYPYSLFEKQKEKGRQMLLGEKGRRKGGKEKGAVVQRQKKRGVRFLIDCSDYLKKKEISTKEGGLFIPRKKPLDEERLGKGGGEEKA